jgi:hypothetical protein
MLNRVDVILANWRRSFDHFPAQIGGINRIDVRSKLLRSTLALGRRLSWTVVRVLGIDRPVLFPDDQFAGRMHSGHRVASLCGCHLGGIGAESPDAMFGDAPLPVVCRNLEPCDLLHPVLS